jgi:hypothetical protein
MGGRTGLAIATIALVVNGCSAEDGTQATSDDEIVSSPLAVSAMAPIATPSGMPEAWAQPDSTGVFNQRGKCGAAAVANALRLYGIEVSPEQADRDGVHFVIGSLARNLHTYLDDHHPQLRCEVDHPLDGAGYLREKLDGGHPVMLWFNTEGGFQQSHWAVAVGHRGAGADEKVIVMSWGAYYEIGMDRLEHAWRFVLGLPHPAVVCEATTSLIVR